MANIWSNSSTTINGRKLANEGVLDMIIIRKWNFDDFMYDYNKDMKFGWFYVCMKSNIP